MNRQDAKHTGKSVTPPVPFVRVAPLRFILPPASRFPLDFRPVIAHLSGTLLLKLPNSVVIDVGGVGYEVVIPVSSFYDLGDVGAPVSLRIYTYVREDALQLFGFRTTREKDLFLRLMSVSGIGPRLAIAMLSGMPADELIPAIQRDDVGRLTSIPGVGRKTAERIVIELRDKMAALAAPGADDEIMAVTSPAPGSVRDDVIAALLSLGYQRAQAEKVVQKIMAQESDQTIEHILRQSLKQLSR